MTSGSYWGGFVPESNQPDFFWGVASVALVERWHEWINRRVETIEFRGRHRVVRRVSLDIEIPADLTSIWRNDTKAGRAPIAKARIPLTFLNKNLLVGFSVQGPDGTPLPIATRSQNRNMCWWALLFTAQDAAGRDISGDLKKSIWDFVNTDDADKASTKLDTLLSQSGPNDLGNDLQEMKANLGKYQTFHWLARELARSFVLYAYVPVDDLSSRTVVKFEYDEPIEPFVKATGAQQESSGRPPSFWMRRATYLSLRPTVFDFPTPATGDTVSYHFEAEPPLGLVFAEGSEMVARARSRRSAARMIVESGKAHFHMPALPAGSYESQVSLRISTARNGGLLRGSRWVVAFITLMLVLGAIFNSRLSEIGSNADAAAALLLALPGLLAAYLVRPTEHILASEVLRGARAVVVAAAVALYAAAWTVLFAEQLERVTAWRWSALQLIWVALATLSAGATVLIWLAGEGSIHIEEEGMNLPITSLVHNRDSPAGYPDSPGGTHGTE